MCNKILRCCSSLPPGERGLRPGPAAAAAAVASGSITASTSAQWKATLCSMENMRDTMPTCSSPKKMRPCSWRRPTSMDRVSRCSSASCPLRLKSLRNLRLSFMSSASSRVSDDWDLGDRESRSTSRPDGDGSESCFRLLDVLAGCRRGGLSLKPSDSVGVDVVVEALRSRVSDARNRGVLSTELGVADVEKATEMGSGPLRIRVFLRRRRPRELLAGRLVAGGDAAPAFGPSGSVPTRLLITLPGALADGARTGSTPPANVLLMVRRCVRGESRWRGDAEL
mmetsp:Transcript_15418/g.48145  ORF Transcript_15418/g.48145 Transcript_15418/m.48145 type:complete len:282 (+) Transcript_15418:864-1709(+)